MNTDISVAQPSCGAGQPGVSELAQAKYLPRLYAGMCSMFIYVYIVILFWYCRIFLKQHIKDNSL
jgi:hypothetical protein